MIGNIRPMGEYDIRHFYSNLSNKLLTLSCFDELNMVGPIGNKSSA